MTDTTAGEARPETLAETCLRMADSRAFDIQLSVRTVLRLAHDALAAQPSAGAQEPTRGDLCRDAKAALDRLIDWCDFNEVQWDACCDDGVPAAAETWTINAKAAKSLLEDDAPRYATPAQPDTGDSLSANMTSVTDFSDAEVKPDTGDVDCFECLAPLVGPFCPECNPAIKAALGYAIETPDTGDAFCGVGWVFDDDDGHEYSLDHPDARGSTVENLRRSTPQEDHLYSLWQSATTPSNTGDVAALRERIARVIDPKAWAKFDGRKNHGYAEHVTRDQAVSWTNYLQPSLTKAADILAAQPSAGAQGEAVGWVSEWTGQMGHLCRAYHPDKHEAADNAKWMQGRSYAVIEATPAQPDTGDVAALRIDAARYRYLRDRDCGPINGPTPAGLFVGRVPDNMILTGEDADQAIDAALSKPNAPGAASEYVLSGNPFGTGLSDPKLVRKPEDGGA